MATLEGTLDDSLRERRATLLVVLAFAATALVLAAVGAYGLLSYESGRRSQEISVRVALGAQRRRVVGLVVGEGLKLTLLGIGIGGLLAFAGTRTLSRFLFEVSPFDPATFLVIALIMLAVTLPASLLPAWRVARADPVAALRAEQSS